MSVEITGLNELLRELERRFGAANMERLNDRALLKGADVLVPELKRNFERFKDEGYSIEEVTIGEPKTVVRKRRVSVHWKGPHSRYRIIHLNEWGTVKNPNPRGKGAIARSIRNSENAYRNAIRETLMGDL